MYDNGNNGNVLFNRVSDNYSKICGSLWQYYRNDPVLTATRVINNFSGNSALFKSKQKITSKAENNGTKNLDIMIPLKYLSNFRRSFEILLVNYKNNLIVFYLMLQIKQQHLIWL